MKILNFFKEKNSENKSAKMIMDKNQLSKVIGGTDVKLTSGTSTIAHEAAHVEQQSK